jgi:hypothetical protein
LPNAERWKSFGWMVIGDADVDEELSTRFLIRREAELRVSALAKLSPGERRVLGV